MKIVFSALSARLGRGQTYLANLFQFVLFDKDLENLVFAPSSLKLLDHPRIRPVEPARPTENPIVRGLWGRWVLPGILKVEKVEKVDVLFCSGRVVGARALASYKVATMFRNMIQFDLHVRKSLSLGLQRLRNWLLSLVMLKSISEAGLTIFISNYTRSIIKSLSKSKNSITIHHGIGSVSLACSKSAVRSNFLSGKECILYVSGFEGCKHHFQVVSACGELSRELYERFSLILVGETTLAEAERLKALIATLGLEDRVLLLGAIPYQELLPLYHYAQLNLFALPCESCPNIPLDVLASGRLMIYFNIMPMPEFGAGAAVCFSSIDSLDIGQVLTEVLTSSEILKKLVVAAVAQSDRFEWEGTSRKKWSELLALAKLHKVGV